MNRKDRIFRRLPVSTGLAALLIGLCFVSVPANAQSAHGLENPVLALNLSRVRDWSPGLQFLNLMKMARPFVAVPNEKDDPQLSYQDLQNQGILDAYGWPRRIPDGYKSIQSFWQWHSLPAQSEHVRGRYLLRYEGAGRLEMEGNGLTVLLEVPGEIRLHMDGSKNFSLHILDTDPEQSGDHIRNITLVAEKNLELYALGAVFNPDWLHLIEDARQIRFMDWNKTNNSKITTWSERAKRGDAPNFSIPLEDMVQLANEIGAEPWFTMPHLADEAYIRAFAGYVRDNLDPRLPIRVEYSNEVWNWSFQQAQWVAAQSVDAWGKDKHIAYQTKKAVETALIWDDVFGTAAETRLIHVLGAHAVNPWRSKTMLEARDWRRHERHRFVEPAQIFDELAITHYFGSFVMSNEQAQADLLSAIKAPDVDATAFLAARLRDPDFPSSLPKVAQAWRKQADLAHAYGLRLVAYEGGQHVHHHGRIGHLSEADQKHLTSFLTEFVRSPEMAALYEESWHLWAQISDGPFMQFGDTTRPTKFGSWGIYESLSESSLRADVLRRLNQNSVMWWDGGPNPAFLQGVVVRGTDEAEIIKGTDEEDYVLAGRGNDRITESLGNDGVHGGPGEDTVELNADPAAYEIHPHQAGVLVTGPQGKDFYLSVETIIFGNGQTLSLADMTKN